jgi:hypothetical protein
MRGFPCRDEKLAAVAVWPAVRHRKQQRLAVLQFEVFVFEFGAVNARTTRAVTLCNIRIKQQTE